MIGVVLDLYGEGLRRIFATLESAGEATEAAREALAADGVVASLMLIHDLYPVGIEQRVEEALDSVRPYMESHGGDVELLGVDEAASPGSGSPAAATAARLPPRRWSWRSSRRSTSTRPTSTASRSRAWRPPPAPSSAPTPSRCRSSRPEPAPATGTATGPPPADSTGARGAAVLVSGGRACGPRGGLVADDDARRPRAARRQRRRLAARLPGPLRGLRLRPRRRAPWSRACSAAPGCGRRYFLPRAGRSLDDDGLQLDPVPLLARDGSVRVALPG